MKFNVKSRDLKEVVNRVIGVVPARTTIAAVENFHLEVFKKNLIVSATDLEISMSSKIHIGTAEDGKVTVNAREFFEIVKNLPDTEVEFTATEDGKVKIKTDSGLYRIAGGSANEFPTLPTISEKATAVSIAADRLSSIIQKTVFAVSKDEQRRSMNGVDFQFNGRDARIYATDGHRLVRVIAMGITDKDVKYDANFQEKALNLIAKNIKGLNVDFLMNDEHAMFRTENTELVCRLITDAHPDFEAVIPKDNNKALVVNREELLEKMKRVAILADSLNHLVKFSIGEKLLVVSSEEMERGQAAEEKLEAAWSEKENMDVGFNANYVADALSHLDSEKVQFLFSTPNRACVIKPVYVNGGRSQAQDVEIDSVLMLIMPLRLN
ncbi:MAG: DNA polymerase III subunit beta [Candidatus Kryptoniota bacterium]